MTRLEAPQDIRFEIKMFSGDVVAFGPFELLRALFHRYVLIHYILVGFLLTLIDTRSDAYGELAQINQQAIVVLFSMIGAVFLLATFAVAFDLIAIRRGRVRFNASPFLLAASAFGVLAGSIAELVTFGDDTIRWLRSAVLLVFYYILVEAIAHILMLVVFPRVLRELRAGSPSGPPKEALDAARSVEALPDHVEIGGRRIKTEALVRIMAEGNYVRVLTQQERLYLPGPFGAAVDPLPERLGVRVARSDWVAKSAVRAIRKEGRAMFVDMQDGAAVRVANSRQKLVLSVLDLPVDAGRI